MRTHTFDSTPKLGTYATPAERNVAVKTMYEVERKTMQEIANHFGISRQRVHQICQRQGAGPGGRRINEELVRTALAGDKSIVTLSGLARAIGNRTPGGLRGMLVRTGMMDLVTRLFHWRRMHISGVRTKDVADEYLQLRERIGRAPSVPEMREAGLNAYRLQRVFGKNYVRKLREMCDGEPRKPRAKSHEAKPIKVEQPAPQEAGV